VRERAAGIPSAEAPINEREARITRAERPMNEREARAPCEGGLAIEREERAPPEGELAIEREERPKGAVRSELIGPTCWKKIRTWRGGLVWAWVRWDEHEP